MRTKKIGRSLQLIQHQTRRHGFRILKPSRHPAPWAWMLICGFATVIPLIFGVEQGQILAAVYGGLAGYFISLSDSEGTLAHRLILATTAAVVTWLALLVGIYVQGHLILFVALATLMTYFLGILAGRGAELERLCLFAVINFLVAKYSVGMNPEVVSEIGKSFFVAYAVTVLGILISRFTLQKRPGEFLSLGKSAREFLTLQPARHIYAMTYAGTILFAIFLVEYFSISRGYWMVITVLLNMKPSRKEGVERIIQRLFGTLLGVFFGEALVLYQPPLEVMIAGIFACGFLVPYVWKKNYWLVTFLATILVILLLSFASFGHVDKSIAFARLHATFWGCMISLSVMLFFRRGERKEIKSAV